MKKIEINFRGYKWDDYDFPETSGIYGIYSTSKNQQGEYIGYSQLISFIILQ